MATTLALAVIGSAVAFGAYAQARHDEKPHGTPAPTTTAPADLGEEAIPLKDGGKLVIRKDGTTYHVDSKGKRVRMKDGVAMEAADGTRYMMKNDMVWKAITEKGTLHPTHQ